MTGQDGQNDTRLEELGYRQQLRRGLGIWSTFSVGVTTVAPVVGLYAIFSLGSVLSGPAWLWMLLASLVAQLLVAVVYAELASEFPVAGGPYQWVRRLVGPRAAWFTGIVYISAVTAALTTVAYLAAPWLGLLFTGSEPHGMTRCLISAGLLVLALALNGSGVKIMRVVVIAGLGAEIVGSIVVGLALLLFFRVHDFSVLFETLGAPASSGNSTGGALLATLAVCGWAFVGFDSSASVAEETKGASANVPRAIVRATAVVGGAVVLVAVAVTLATKDLAAVVHGEVVDPVTPTVIGSFGSWSQKPFLAVVVVTFLACLVSMQAYLGRVTFGLARDGMLPASKKLAAVTGRGRVPLVAMAVTSAAAAAGLLLGLNDGAIGTMITFGTGGLYITFLLVVAAALFARLTGRWQPGGTLRLGRKGMVVNVLAFCWLAFETVNIAWPRTILAPPGAPVWQVWAVVWVFAALAGLAGLYLVIARPHLGAGTGKTS
ncbi:APC family permease [Streptomyces stelliscabiei]|uniref:APC family permease n=1 Tax=Streptomyces stelliscabiei TaxID=146820 RepID=UPI0029B940F7|nr:APC family permease [Streptomyces stelliscabiei]MDX2552533.1 APC family permease [Streptomyces stelliscabiei]MDX2611928.1 APC family permease [Streptomyces stelliscabiei]MDX2637275.1 APC family permease [Streptomyces stelliscabiei]MDX2660694.1 APC family permease [Streptomyces stelliscabiei]MDX2715008.1 APC family permease [Streptomyces stelliscabiei]